MSARRKPFALIPDGTSDDTVEALRDLLEQAERGELIGIAFAAMYRQRQFMVDTAGECHRNPAFTRGMVCALDDELGRRTRGDS